MMTRRNRKVKHILLTSTAQILRMFKALLMTNFEVNLRDFLPGKLLSFLYKWVLKGTCGVIIRPKDSMSYPPNIFKNGVPLLTRDEDDSPNAVYVDPPNNYLSEVDDEEEEYSSYRGPSARSNPPRTPIRR